MFLIVETNCILQSLNKKKEKKKNITTYIKNTDITKINNNLHKHIHTDRKGIPT